MAPLNRCVLHLSMAPSTEKDLTGTIAKVAS